MEAKFQAEAPPTDQTSEPGASFYGWYVTVVLTLCYTLGFVDNKILFILTEAIKSDLGLTDTQIGLIVGPAFSFTYAICAIPIARISDRNSRKMVMSVAIIAWSSLTALGGMANSFLTLILSRTGVAVGESACTPAAHSLISDYIPERSRGKAMAIYSTGIAFGAFISLALGGLLSDLYGWRITLITIGSAGIILTALVFLTVREPIRKGTSGQVGALKQGKLLEELRSFFKDPVLRHIVIGGTLLCIMTGSHTAWGPAYAMRNFELSSTQVGVALGIAGGSVGFVGIMAGGVVGDWLNQKDRRYGFWLLAGAFILAAITKIVAMLAPDFAVFVGFAALSGGLTLFYPGLTYATVQSRANPRSRSFAAAITMFCLHGIGLGSGAFLAGLLSDLLTTYFGSNDSLRWSLIITSFIGVWAAFHYYWASRQFAKPSPSDTYA